MMDSGSREENSSSREEIGARETSRSEPPQSEPLDMGDVNAALRALASRRRSSPTKRLLPVMDPRFNLREVAKQMLLLEDHLAQPRRRCEDCIRKHFALIEAFAEEAVNLDTEDRYGAFLAELQEVTRRMQADHMSKAVTPQQLAASLREIRKPLLKVTTEWFFADKYFVDNASDQQPDEDALDPAAEDESEGESEKERGVVPSKQAGRRLAKALAL